MMKLTLFISSAILVLSTACTTGQSIDENNTVTVAPEQVEVISKTADSITIRMVNTCGSACWEDLQEVIEQDENLISITTIAQVTSQICTQQCVRYEREYTVDMPAPGDYTLEFVHRDSVYQRLNITLP